MTVDVDLANYDPMDRAVQQCPFPHYAALRAATPVFHHPQTGLYFVSRLDTIKAVLRDTETFSSRFSNAPTTGSPAVRAALTELADQGVPRVETMLTLDPPMHTRYRKLVNKAFSARRIAELEPTVRALTTELIDDFPQQGRLDFMNRFAVPLPVRVIAHMLNMPDGMEAEIKQWSDDAVAALGVNISDERRIEAATGTLEFQRFWLGLIADRRRAPQDDIVTDLAGSDLEELDGTVRPLTDAEIISIIAQLMVAGNETTTKLFTEGMRLLIENPAEWNRIRADAARVPAMVEEALRLSSPNQGLFRVVTRDTELEGVPLAKGSRLWVMFGSANRDERTYPDPDRFDPDRVGLKEHVAFGFGAHFCIGAPLSRLEARVGFEELSRRLSSVAFAPGNSFEYEPSYILRGLKSLDLDIVRSS